MKISILTATYNRSKYLGRLYKSLVNNINNEYEIEWLIMDDGSTDNTEEECKKFINIDGLEVKYYKEQNQGKMIAINNLSMNVTGDLWIECDSDDYFIDDCFKYMVDEYAKIKNDNEIYAMVFLKNDQNSNNMGKNFKKNKTTMFDLYFKDEEDGEKALVFVANIRKKYKYELEKDEKFVTEARMYHKMDKKNKVFCINKAIMVCEYQNEGYSKNIKKQFIKNPFGYYKYFYEILKDMNMSGVKFAKRLYVIKHYILFTYLTKSKLTLNVKNTINKILIILLYIPGIIKSNRFKKKYISMYKENKG